MALLPDELLPLYELGRLPVARYEDVMVALTYSYGLWYMGPILGEPILDAVLGTTLPIISPSPPQWA